jgi:hypothetical protein
MVRGAMHVHSTYSDGEFTVAELRKIFLTQGCAFVCMTDHAEYFDQKSIQDYIRDLNTHSDETFHFVKGLEYECQDRMHILGYGADQLTSTTDPQAVIRYIDSQGAVSVIAHPKEEFFPCIESFETLPQGIETWNSKYDGRYAPRPVTFALLQHLQQSHPAIHAFYGQDLHWKKQFRGLVVELHGESAEPQAVLAALASGNYHGRKDDLRLPSSGLLPEELLAEFGRMHQRSYRMRNFLKNGKQVLDRVGIHVPKFVKAHLRRIL